MSEIKVINLPNDILGQIPQNSMTGMLLSGDRISCCEYAVIAIEGETLKGLCTIAPHGEQGSGIPTIVALYVFPQYRGRLLGRRLLKFAIDFMVESELTPIRIDALSSDVIKLIDSIRNLDMSNLQIIDYKGVLDFLNDGKQTR